MSNFAKEKSVDLVSLPGAIFWTVRMVPAIRFVDGRFPSLRKR